ncbi:DNA-J related domain-containing protein [Saccharospirillum mangrovi]|uniref:DNA-J related domain-containing protein n=1 Tax=Saccharospirillum mangrovi TaxID=2161747 RepID=UPI000D3689EE|nr:DNA-J related domain-containing protein [Saccharospirillum mangrovi]
MNSPNLPPELKNAVAQCLTATPAGLSEFELIKQLDDQYADLYPKPDLTDPLLLFQHHFVLMHVLYRLQDDWWQSGRCLLDIGPLNIAIRPIGDGDSQQLSQNSSLRDYYLNWSNLKRETTASVQELLDGFWKRLLGEENRPQALAELGLDDNADTNTIRTRYRQLANRHHPDKGGDPDEFHRIRNAYEQLMASQSKTD